MPTGYFSAVYDVYHLLIIGPGKDLIFSVPANHLAPSWDIQIPFQFSLPAVKQGVQPLCYAIFTWEDLPESYRTASANSSAKPGGAKH
jgi:hypothetical protein